MAGSSLSKPGDCIEHVGWASGEALHDVAIRLGEIDTVPGQGLPVVWVAIARQTKLITVVDHGHAGLGEEYGPSERQAFVCPHSFGYSGLA